MNQSPLSRLVWLDMEMTGLDPQTDRVLEIATVVTDGHLNVLAKGPDLVVHQPEEILAAMGPWCQRQHGLSGLTEAVRHSTVTVADAEAQTLAFLESMLESGVSPLCGNTVSQDRRFLRHYMPALEAFFHYRHFDVSSLKIACMLWQPEAVMQKTGESHRAMDDVLESIDECRRYQVFFQ